MWFVYCECVNVMQYRAIWAVSLSFGCSIHGPNGVALSDILSLLVGLLYSVWSRKITIIIIIINIIIIIIISIFLFYYLFVLIIFN